VFQNVIYIIIYMYTVGINKDHENHQNQSDCHKFNIEYAEIMLFLTMYLFLTSPNKIQTTKSSMF